MLFVDDYKPEVGIGEEYRCARAENDTWRTVTEQGVPMLDTNVVGKLAVIHNYLVAKCLLQSVAELRGQCYLGHKHQGLSSLLEGIVDEVDVYLRFAA